MSRYTDHEQASNVLKEIERRPDKYLIIHYSCESFYNLNGKSPRIASISVRKYNDGQTINFSMHQYLEKRQHSTTDESSQTIEKELLEDFFSYVSKNGDKFWIHWNMRDTVFGFHALEHRFKVLGGDPTVIDDDKKIDLAHLLKLYFGGGYISNPHIEKLALKNGLKPYRFLTGEKEAEAFNNQEYNELSMSTSSKTNLFSTFVTMLIDGTLKTDIPKWKIRGVKLSGLLATFQETTYGKLIFWILNLVIGGIIGAIIAKYV
ncbi:hypothetical protein AB3329_07850 [Streptococcus sp. H31]|uniref:hypothetical protein n=1 Tax=Streptococcus huangxiaojuni TaxID=3237239 RepID=UPI0034A4FAEA